ncbi:MAG: hypothetical protein WC998_02425 [Candidatus Paceibacterota bacterium]|jgi:hypothetical protein
MYKKLKELNLEKYINHFCGGVLVSDKYFNALENFVNSLTTENFQTLKSKLKGNKKNSEIADLLHEVEVAYVFHPRARFNVDGPDLENGISIEIKTLNESKEENNRHQRDSFSCVSPILANEKKTEEHDLIIAAVRNKANYHLEKANKQLKGKGLIYLIWDYDNLLHGNDGQVHRKILDGNSTQKIINEVVKEFTECHPCLTIKNLYFADLRNLVTD